MTGQRTMPLATSRSTSSPPDGKSEVIGGDGHTLPEVLELWVGVIGGKPFGSRHSTWTTLLAVAKE